MRRIVQVNSSTACGDSLGVWSLICALCDDGTLWLHTPGTSGWVRAPDLPQDPEVPVYITTPDVDKLEDIPF